MWCIATGSWTSCSLQVAIAALTAAHLLFIYYAQDHLGNNRTVENESGTIEQVNHYYPFGGIFNDVGFDSELQPYRYNGKELDRMGGLNTYDYGARQYFSSLPTWDRMDPLCEDNYAVSPYAYVRNNPMLYTDLYGLLEYPADSVDWKNYNTQEDNIKLREVVVVYNRPQTLES